MRSALLASALIAASLGAQQTPTNDAPNPYKSIEGWAKLPAGRTWGSTSAVDIDKDGVSVWVAERCGTNSCVGSNLDPILKFDKDGNLVKSFGAGMFAAPHGIYVDKDGNIWVTDCACTGGGGGRGGRGANPPAPATSGHQIYKFSPDGKLLLTLGKAGGGRGEEFFWQPNDVLVAPDGSIFVDEGHSSNDSAAARVYKFDKTGKLVKTYGKWGKGDGELDQPHALAMDSKGRLFVADRGNNRLLIMDQDLKVLDTWYQFSRISGLAIRNDTLYAADSESETVNPAHSDWKRGIRIGAIKDGKVFAFIPDPWPKCPQGQRGTADAPCSTSTSAAEGVAVDKNGVIYGAEVGPRRLMRYVR
ncbi:MAG TPA: peptidyl-alpha-hydroxyglycine alpha-amidating lyase family protein [Gemmatimonadaceae bacterium]|nr:peptidyl-alpha-hydroxyglycine alpha-amidating lyase family protein [Gemmatimonadaceae bacterium]